MTFVFCSGILFLILALMIALFAGQKFIDAYLKPLGGEDKFNYRRWKLCFALSLLLFGVGFILWSKQLELGPDLCIIGLILRPVLTFTLCKKPKQ